MKGSLDSTFGRRAPGPMFEDGQLTAPPMSLACSGRRRFHVIGRGVTPPDLDVGPAVHREHAERRAAAAMSAASAVDLRVASWRSRVSERPRSHARPILLALERGPEWRVRLGSRSNQDAFLRLFADLSRFSTCPAAGEDGTAE